MKVIIIEGPDNTGKNTLINDILEKNEIVKIIHCSKPKTDNPFLEQCLTFGDMVKGLIVDYHTQDVLLSADVIVFNRAWYGEYVYGQMYRNGNPDSIKEMITILEDNIAKKGLLDSVYYVQLNSTSAKFLKENDDNKSLSGANLIKIKKEIKLFNEIFDFSILNKKKIIVNDGDEFRTREDILTDFNNFINN